MVNEQNATFNVPNIIEVFRTSADFSKMLGPAVIAHSMGEGKANSVFLYWSIKELQNDEWTSNGIGIHIGMRYGLFCLVKRHPYSRECAINLVSDSR